MVRTGEQYGRVARGNHLGSRSCHICNAGRGAAAHPFHSARIYRADDRADERAAAEFARSRIRVRANGHDFVVGRRPTKFGDALQQGFEIVALAVIWSSFCLRSP